MYLKLPVMLLKIGRYCANIQSMDTLRNQLKTLNHQFAFYSKQKTASKNNLIALLDMTYPGVNTLFDSPARDDGSQKWVDFSEIFWHVDCIRNMSLSAFTERYRKWCKRHGYNFQSSKPAEIYSQSKNLIAVFPKDDLTKLSLSNQLRSLIQFQKHSSISEQK